MPTLSSLLVQREIATMRAVENAISRQVLHGGDLPTNLLELGAVNEPALARVLGESIGLEPAAAGPGTTVQLVVRGTPRPARIVPMPFAPHRYHRG